MPESAQLTERLKQGLNILGENPDQHPLESYLLYLQLLEKWNKAYNLSGIRQAEMMLSHHLFDSLSVLPFLSGKHAFDVGTGAGLPGLILALARPDMHWTLLDSNQKKLNFIQQIVLEAKIDNVEIVHSRIEEFDSQSLYSCIVSCAMTSAADLFRHTEAFLSERGRLILMKGPAVADELAELQSRDLRVVMEEVDVPELPAQRTLLIIERQH